MEIVVIGAGAIGGWIGARLAAAEYKVSFLARGDTLDALKREGIGLKEEGDTRYYPCYASNSPAELGKPDLLILATKGQALPELAPSLSHLVGPNTIILPLLNGIPWWFMQGEMPLTSVDPKGLVARTFPAENILGSVVYAGASMSEKGISELYFCNRLILGQPDGQKSERLSKVVDMIQRAGIPCDGSSNIRSEIWLKLLGNMTLNPMSALTLSTLDKVMADKHIRELIKKARNEGTALGQKIGCEPIIQSDAERKKVVSKLVGFKSSMLQDVEAGRSIELDALLAAPIEIADHHGLDVPTLRGLFGLTRVMAQSRGLY